MNYNGLKLTDSPAPHIHARENTARIMGNVFLALLPTLCFAVYHFGWQALANTALSIAGCCGFEWVWCVVMKKTNSLPDLSAAMTGTLLAFVCPVSIPFWALLAGDFFAIVIVKQLYGGIGKNFLNPALTARAFMLLWAGNTVQAVSGATPVMMLHQNKLSALQQTCSLGDLLVGFTGGCVGEVSALLLLTGGIYLILRKIISWHIPFCYIGTVALLTFLFPRGNDPITWMLYHLLSDGIMLGAFFIATDYTTSPMSRLGQIVFGVGCGAFTVLFRYDSPGGEGMCYAIPLMNLTVWLLDRRLRPVRFLEFIEPPKALKGIPIAIISAGLIVLVFAGLVQ